ncbi:DciA family protein [Streptomyces sp. NPDC088557]|uniref:DciA family protein n=1 Tax=Streptomyces sp. NPDC088557 TaxID=3365867 RepID=UPI00380CAB4F
MTETTQTAAAVPGQAEATGPSGADLARLMLQRALQDAKQRGTDRPGPARRPKKPAIRYHGRAPMGLAGTFESLLTDRGWDVPLGGGGILERWPDIAATIAPGLAAHTAAVAFDPATGQLDLLPDSPAYATQLRLMTHRILTAANETTGAAPVRTVRVRQPGTLATAPAPTPGRGTAPARPVKTRETASEGFRQTLAAHRASYTPFQQDPALAAAVTRQGQARRDLGTRSYPDTEDGQDHGTPEADSDPRAQQRQTNEATRAAAILLARADRARRTAPPSARPAAGRVST